MRGMNGLTKEQVVKLKQALLDEQQVLERHFRLEAEEGQGSLTDVSGELSAYDNHPADLATDTYERERDAAIDDQLSQEQVEIQEALNRMEAGTYGICEASGLEIGYERLEALPATRFCIAHAQQNQDEPYRPIEEQVMTPPPSGVGEHRQRQAGHFDEADAWKAVEEYGNSSDEQETGISVNSEATVARQVNE